MICLIALVVFGVLGIFSATHRKIALEAFDCVFRRITLRPCESGLNVRLKSSIVGKLGTKSPAIGGFVFRNFEILSWTFTILMIASVFYTAYGGYNYYQYGNCYGPEDSAGFCPFAAFAGETSSGYQSDYAGEVVFPTIDDDPSIGPTDAKVTIIEFGCFMCPYTKQAEPIVKELLKKYGGKIRFVFRDFPLPTHKETKLHAIAADCALEQGRYWEFHDKLFEIQEECGASSDHRAMIEDAAKKLEIDVEKFDSCIESGRYDDEVDNDIDAGVKTGLAGTPTFFINNRTITGPKPIAAFEEIIEEELEK